MTRVEQGTASGARTRTALGGLRVDPPLVVLVALGVYAVVRGIAWGLGSPAQPGAGLWPVICGLTILVGAVITATRPDSGGEAPAGLRQVGGAVVLLGVFVVLLDLVGLTIAAAVLVGGWVRLLGRESWLVTAVTSLVLVVAVDLVFGVLLAVPLPGDVVLDPLLALVDGR